MIEPKLIKDPHSALETHLFQHGVQSIAGLDEAGRGAWAGPVTAAAVILPPPDPELERRLRGLRDSKQLSPTDRQRWDRNIRHLTPYVSVAQATVEEIDQLGILVATRLAMRRAVNALDTRADHLLIDYILIGDVGINQTAIPRGDTHIASIAAASVVAKVARDAVMLELDQQYPRYGFAQHKGYGTLKHRESLTQFGPTPVHRRSFKPVQQHFSSNDDLHQST